MIIIMIIIRPIFIVTTCYYAIKSFHFELSE